MAEWTKGKPQVATRKQWETYWGGGFWCKFCGYRFKVGDTWRFINGTPAGIINFKVCEKCDAPDEELLARFKDIWEKAKYVFGESPVKERPDEP